MTVVWLQSDMKKKITNKLYIIITDIILSSTKILFRIDDFLLLFRKNNNNPRYLCPPCVPPNLLYTH